MPSIRSVRAGLMAVAALGLVGTPAWAGTVTSPEQISNFTRQSTENALNQAVAMKPNGTGMGIAYEKYNNGGADVEAFVVQPLDAEGQATGTPTRIMDEVADSVGVYDYSQPAIAYNPQTGGWLACAGLTVGAASTKDVYCAYLNADGTRNGGLFVVSRGQDAMRILAQTVGIAWSTVKNKFLVAYTGWESDDNTPYDNGLRWVGATGGAEGAGPTAIPLPPGGVSPYSQGGLGNLIYVPGRDNFALTLRARASNSEGLQPWLYAYDGDAVLQAQVPFDNSGGTAYQSGNVAYVQATGTYVISTVSTGGGDILMRSTPASAPAALAATASIAVPLADFRTTRFRVSTVAHPTEDQVLLTTALNRTTATGGGRGIYVIQGTSSSLAAPELVDITNTADDPSNATPGNRPRVTFSSDGCGYVLSYNKQTVEAVSTQWMTARYVASTGLTCPQNVNRALTVAKAGDGAGTVTSSPAGIDCGATCTASITDGTAVTLTAIPATGSTFTGWSGDCSGSSTCVVTMSAAKSVTATFTKSTAPSPAPTPGSTPQPTAAPPSDPIVRPITSVTSTALPNGRVRSTFRLRYQQTGRYSFFLQDKKGKRIPMRRNSTVGTRVLTKTFWAPVVQQGQKDAGVRINVLTSGRLPAGAVLRVVLRNPDGSIIAQSVPAKP